MKQEIYWRPKWSLSYIIPKSFDTEDILALEIRNLPIRPNLTLVLMPTMYSLMDDLSQFAKRVVAVARAR